MGPNKTTAADRRRNTAIKQMSCICCQKRGMPKSPAQVHHIVEGRKRLGNVYTLPLCDYHHMGYRYSRFAQPGGWSREETVNVLGPSLADNKKLFHVEFGTERELLAEVNKLLENPEALAFAEEVYV